MAFLRLSVNPIETLLIKRGEIIRDFTVWDFKMWPLAVLMGDRINGGFSREMKGRFDGREKVAVITQ